MKRLATSDPRWFLALFPVVCLVAAVVILQAQEHSAVAHAALSAAEGPGWEADSLPISRLGQVFDAGIPVLVAPPYDKVVIRSIRFGRILNESHLSLLHEAVQVPTGVEDVERGWPPGGKSIGPKLLRVRGAVISDHEKYSWMGKSGYENGGTIIAGWTARGAGAYRFDDLTVTGVAYTTDRGRSSGVPFTQTFDHHWGFCVAKPSTYCDRVFGRWFWRGPR